MIGYYRVLSEQVCSCYRILFRVAYRIFSGGGGYLTDDLRMYMRRCHAYILVNKSHNNAVITNDFFLFVYVIILFVLYILHVYYFGILGGGGGGGGGEILVCPPPPCMQPCSCCYLSGYIIQGVSLLCSLTPLSLCRVLLCMYRRRPLPTYFAHAHVHILPDHVTVNQLAEEIR